MGRKCNTFLKATFCEVFDRAEPDAAPAVEKRHQLAFPHSSHPFRADVIGRKPIRKWSANANILFSNLIRGWVSLDAVQYRQGLLRGFLQHPPTALQRPGSSLFERDIRSTISVFPEIKRQSATKNPNSLNSAPCHQALGPFVYRKLFRPAWLCNGLTTLPPVRAAGCVAVSGTTATMCPDRFSSFR